MPANTWRRESPTVHEQSMAVTTLAREQGFAGRLAHGTVLHGWALATQGQGEAGIAEVRQGIAEHLIDVLNAPHFSQRDIKVAAMTPGSDSGKVTRRNRATGPSPRSVAASSSERSIFSRET